MESLVGLAAREAGVFQGFGAYQTGAEWDRVHSDGSRQDDVWWKGDVSAWKTENSWMKALSLFLYYSEAFETVGPGRRGHVAVFVTSSDNAATPMHVRTRELYTSCPGTLATLLPDDMLIDVMHTCHAGIALAATGRGTGHSTVHIHILMHLGKAGQGMRG